MRGRHARETRAQRDRAAELSRKPMHDAVERPRAGGARADQSSPLGPLLHTHENFPAKPPAGRAGRAPARRARAHLDVRYAMSDPSQLTA